MNENQITIQNIIATLQELDIKSTYDNMNKLMGCLQRLADIRDKIGSDVCIDKDCVKDDAVKTEVIN